MRRKTKQIPNTKCKICGKEFYVKPYFVKHGWGQYCSRECQYKAYRKGKFVYCEICGKKIWRQPHEFEQSKSNKFFCSKSHQTLWRNKEFSGPRHGNWKGGEHIHHKRLLIQNKIKPVCKLCDCKDKRVLVVHHLDRNRKHNNIKNLVYLCHNCHHLVHCHNISV